ncbi:PREDICTED: peptidyl-prolyl cis-trans isomerase CYP26-2, chloroplastic [Nelumbo nucifera]|uniref:Peptidyl-prolyl cis-trans isomerase CYP26-2, chloroplastic n=1 Tax=Nelumbo nucifera TaxID=4432 RepID=A0A1U8ARE5_NELNU|nr:PREDICTED: peptidyl-prolyl cis-trans isomerase CYP26-2, chloroplastic [Nelumbo nucifera]
MWNNLQTLHSSSAQLPQLPAPPSVPASPSQIQTNPIHHLTPTSHCPCPPILKHNSKLSRRELTIRGSSFSLLLGTHIIEPFQLSKARAEGDQHEENPKANVCTDKTPTKKAFLDISIDGEPVGRIIVGLYDEDVPNGTTRFSKLVSGAAGISYRRKEFIRIMPNYVQHGGVRSYGVDADLAKETGRNLDADNLLAEWNRVNEICSGTKNLVGSVGIIVRDPLQQPPKLKLVARKGKLEIDEEEVGTAPNGTEFVIATRDSPELDASSLVVGRVLSGMDVVERIAQVKTVKENTSSPYFRVAKLIGDKRAVVAERGFNRPYSKVIVTNCGLLD